jgi:glycosyltransferase 2 family protein
MKSWLYSVVGIFVSIFFVYLAVRRVDVAESIRALRDMQPILVGMAILVYLACFPILALRWRLILRTQKALSWREIMMPLFVGYMANNLLPARTGEVYRAHVLGRRTRISRSGVMASIVVERTFDGLMLVCMILLVFVLFPQTHFLGSAALVTGLAFLALAAGILLYNLMVDKAHRITNWGLELLPQLLRKHVSSRLNVFLQGIRGISTAKQFLAAGIFTVLVWVLDACAIDLVVVSFGVSLPLSGFVLVFTLATLSTTLPSGSGYIGPFQYAFVVSLGAFAISQETALAVSVITQLVVLGPVTLIGLALLWREQLLTQGSRSEDKLEDEA